MPREPKKDEEKKPVRSAEDDEVENEPKVRSYYYDDAHGYEDYEPAEDRMEDEEEVTERTPES
ncbi:MAG: hypothetical protein IPM25_08420 [Chloracidobacterium sp.]|nr:hypothetical protein [Chloracidobacterium sp.]